jgi:hypothetical protein
MLRFLNKMAPSSMEFSGMSYGERDAALQKSTLGRGAMQAQVQTDACTRT